MTFGKDDIQLLPFDVTRDLIAGFWEEFRAGALARGVPETTAEKVFGQVIAFSEFGFPKSHAAAFGLLAYQSAWLRHYHPVEYYVALFNNQPMGFYSLDALGRDAMRNGIAHAPQQVRINRAVAPAHHAYNATHNFSRFVAPSMPPLRSAARSCHTISWSYPWPVCASAYDLPR